MRGIVCVMLLGLGGCGLELSHDPRIEAEVAQATIDSLIPACRDGVQYLASPYNGASKLVAPRFKPDGTLYRCSQKAIKYQQLPLEQ